MEHQRVHQRAPLQAHAAVPAGPWMSKWTGLEFGNSFCTFSAPKEIIPFAEIGELTWSLATWTQIVLGSLGKRERSCPAKTGFLFPKNLHRAPHPRTLLHTKQKGASPTKHRYIPFLTLHVSSYAALYTLLWEQFNTFSCRQQQQHKAFLRLDYGSSYGNSWRVYSGRKKCAFDFYLVTARV